MAELDIAAFLRARLDEREKRQWLVHDTECAFGSHSTDLVELTVPSAVCDCPEPEFMLTDVAAKRQILAMHKHTATRAGDRLEHCSCQDDWSTIFGRYWPCDTLSLLALPYAGHPDYREEWKP